MLNRARQSYGAGELNFDFSLNQLAQQHSSLQIQNNFVGGAGLNSKAQQSGIAGLIGNNVEVNQNLTSSQLTIERSPSKLRRMVDPNWVRVGIGVVRKSDGFYYLTQLFASRDLRLSPLNDAEVEGVRSQVLAYVREINPFITGEDTTLSSQLQFQVSLPDRPFLGDYLPSIGYPKVQITIL